MIDYFSTETKNLKSVTEAEKTNVM